MHWTPKDATKTFTNTNPKVAEQAGGKLTITEEESKKINFIQSNTY